MKSTFGGSTSRGQARGATGWHHDQSHPDTSEGFGGSDLRVLVDLAEGWVQNLHLAYTKQLCSV